MLRTPDALCWKAGESVGARASILGCDVSNVPKLIRKGELTRARRPSRRSLPSLDLGEVEALAEHRAAEREARQARSPRQVPARGPTPRSRARVAFATAGGRTPWGYAASGPRLHPSRRTANGGEGGTVLGAEGSARTGGGCAAGAQDETPLSDPPMRQRNLAAEIR